MTLAVQMLSLLTGVLIVVIVVDNLMALPILIIMVVFYHSIKVHAKTIQALRNLEATGSDTS